MSTNHNFWRERRAEAVLNRGPSAYQPNVLPLGQTGSHLWGQCFAWLLYFEKHQRGAGSLLAVGGGVEREGERERGGEKGRERGGREREGEGERDRERQTDDKKTRKNNSNNPATNNNKTLLILIEQNKTVHILGCGHLTRDKRPNKWLYDKQAAGRMKQLPCRWFKTFLFHISQQNSWAVQQARLYGPNTTLTTSPTSIL